MLSVAYAECHVFWLSCVPIVTYKPFMLSVVMLSIIMLSVIMLSAVMLSVVAPTAVTDLSLDLKDLHPYGRKLRQKSFIGPAQEQDFC